MNREITIPMVVSDTIASFQSTVDGEWIHSKSQQRDYLKRTGLALFDEVYPDTLRVRKEMDEQEAVKRKQDVIDAFHKCESGYIPEKIPEAEIIPCQDT